MVAASENVMPCFPLLDASFLVSHSNSTEPQSLEHLSGVFGDGYPTRNEYG